MDSAEVLLPRAGTTSAPATKEEYFTVAEVSAHWKCDAETVRRKIRRGQIASRFIGGKHLIPDSALQAFEHAASAPIRARAGGASRYIAKQGLT
jgi:excisionase family DNA binding protein